ncbi:MAG TPA: hypothetical protein VK668_08385 [Mucilaginibacter sp.]|nr:hypothetical protein [Mucilaginibacter sp.]
MKRILIIILLLWIKSASAQYGSFYKSVINQPKLFKPLAGSFIAHKVKTTIVDGESRKLNYSYLFNNKSLRLEYFYPESKTDSGCSYFILNGHRVNLKGHFEHDFACDLDVASFKVYKGQYNGEKYLLLTCINTGSGSSTSSVICNLFDITDKRSIKYYPLWSKYGSESCFGDFDKDGSLDFLKVRIQGDNDTLRLSLMSLKRERFIPYKEDHYMILNYDSKKIKIEQRHWFN